MITPSLFKQTDPTQLQAFIHQHSFATLITQNQAHWQVSHVNLLPSPQNQPTLVLMGHLAKANPQSQHMATHPNALAIFMGAHTYISPTWSVSKAVPTWNYTAVHAYGRIELITQPEELKDVLTHLIQRYEKMDDNAWYRDWEKGQYDFLLSNLVGFKLIVSHLEGTFKLSQNKSHTDQMSIIEHLKQENNALSQDVAALMHRNIDL